MDGAPKWFTASKSFWGLAVTAIGLFLGGSGYVDLPVITELLTELSDTGTVAIGTIIGLIGLATRKTTIKFWNKKTG